MSEQIVLTHQQIVRKVNRMAMDIEYKTFNEPKVTLAGLSHKGFRLAKLIAQHLSPDKYEVIQLKVDKAHIADAELDMEQLNESHPIVVVDDVLHSGRILMHTLTKLMVKPFEKVLVAVLVDRFHRRYPIRSDIRGLEMATSLHNHVEVNLTDEDNFVAFLK